MPYEVNNTRGTLVATVLDGTLNTTSSSLKLIGQGKSNYGETLNENLYALLENFASPTPPTFPIRGQIWYDTSVDVLKVKINESGPTDVWMEIGGAIETGTSLPGTGNIGDLFWHTAEGALYVWNGLGWLKIFPSSRIQNNSNTTFAEVDPSQPIVRITTNSSPSAEFGSTDTLFRKQFRARLASNQTFSGSQVWDCNTQQVFSVVLTGPTTLNIVNFQAGGKYTLIVRQDVTGNRTLTFNGTAWLWPSGTVPLINTVGYSVTVMEFVSDGSFVILSTVQGGIGGSGGSSNPVGTVLPFAGGTIPTGWLVCDGSAVSRTEWPDLFSVIGTTYGIGNGSTTFNLPDARGRSIIGVGQGSGLSNRALGATGGTETQAISVNQLPAHTHTANHTHTGSTDSVGNHGHPFAVDTTSQSSWNSSGSGGFPTGGASTIYGPYTGTPNGSSDSQIIGGGGAHSHTLTINSATVTTSSVGNGEAHNNMQPFIVMNYIIFAGIQDTGSLPPPPPPSEIDESWELIDDQWITISELWENF